MSEKLDCLTQALNFIKKEKPDLNKKVVKDIGSKMKFLIEQNPSELLNSEGELNPTSVSKIQTLLKEAVTLENKRLALEKYRNLQVRLVNESSFNDGQGKGVGEYDIVKSRLSGSVQQRFLRKVINFFKSDVSIRSVMQSQAKKFQGAFEGMLDKAGLREFSMENKANTPVIMELYNMENGIESKAEAPIKALAKIVNSIQTQLFQLKQGYSAFLEARPNWLTRQIHDRVKVGAKTFEQWKTAMLPLLSDETFEELRYTEKTVENEHGVKEKKTVAVSDEKFAERVNKQMFDDYTRIKNGTFGTWRDYDWKKTEPNRVKALSRQRSYIFKDAASFAKYNEQFGFDNWSDHINNMINRTAKDVAVIQEWGSHPMEAASEFIEHSIENAKNAKEAEKIKNNKSYLMTHFINNIENGVGSGYDIVSSTARGMRLWAATTKLMNAAFSAFTDQAVGQTVITSRFSGKNMEGSVESLVAATMKGMKNGEERKAVANALYFYSHGNISKFFDMLEEKGGVAGKTLSKVLSTAGKGNGLGWEVECERYGGGLVISKMLAGYAHMDWATLTKENPALLRSLTNAGATEKMWNGYLRHAVMDGDKLLEVSGMHPDEIPEGMKGHKLLNAATLDQLDDKFIESHLKLTLSEEMQKKYASKGIPKEFILREREKGKAVMAALMGSALDRISTTATTREMTDLMFGADGRSAAGAIMQTLMMFKSASLSQFNSQLELYKNGMGPKGKIAIMSQYGARLLWWGFLAHTAKRWMQGKQNEPVQDLWKKVFIEAGVGGPTGDAVWRMFDSKPGKDRADSLLESLGGPVLGEVTRAAGLAADYVTAIRGKNKPPNKDAWLWANRNVFPGPLNNIPGVKLLADHAFGFGVADHLGEGYLGRLTKKDKYLKIGPIDLSPYNSLGVKKR